MTKVNILNKRAINTQIAKETLEICDNKRYKSSNGNIVDIENQLDFAIQNTKLYSKEIEEKLFVKAIPDVKISNETTNNAAERFLAEGKTDIVALNFASAINEGGGFIGGSIAQEEDLCRASGLYHCLKTQPDFYKNNKDCCNQLYTDDIIYSPRVPFFRDNNHNLLDNPYSLSIITSPAPCIRDMDVDDKLEEEINHTLFRRGKKILQIAAENNHKNIILGAWGTGAFGNKPAAVALIFKLLLKTYPFFENVCFAVFDKQEQPTTFDTFVKVFS